MSRLVARLAVATVALGVTAGGAALIVACGDLFHKTDFPTLCEVDAQACAVEGGPGGDGGDVDAGDGGPGGIDLCAQKPSLEAARACYASDAYQDARRHRDGAAVTHVVIVEGV